MERIPNWAWIALLAVAIIAGGAWYAYAQEAVVVAPEVVPTGAVIVPLSLWISAARDFIIAIASASIPIALAKVVPKWMGAIMTSRVEQMLIRAIDYAINAVAGAAKDKPLSVNVGNEVLAKALQYVVDKAPGWMVEWTGGSKNLREMIIARLDLDPEASVEAAGGKLVTVEAKHRR